MKIALVHDYIKEYGGAERVLETLHAMFPNAPVYTSVYLPDYLGPHKERFANWDIRTSKAQLLPFKAKLISPLRLLSPWLFKSFDLSSYDVVIVSATGAYFPNAIQTKKITNKHSHHDHTPLAISHKPYHLCYCHTPPRYLYGYATAREWKKNKVLHVLGEAANHFLRMVDFTASKNVDQYIANSEEVKARISKFYRKDAIVVYPPITIAKGTEQTLPAGRQGAKRGEEAYFVAGGRLARPKHIDLIIKTCVALDLPLKVFGKAFAGYGEELEKLANGKWRMVNGKRVPLVTFMGEVSDEEKYALLRGAKAYIFASEDEDFGMLPVEAMAQGTPVIAFRSGGVQETVLDGKTGLFFTELSVESLSEALEASEKKKWDDDDIMKRAEEFSEETFMRKIKQIVEQYSK